MTEKRALFGDYYYCASCSRLLPKDYEFEKCPLCIENDLFRQVRDYIRANDVTEYDVAAEFDLPISRVKTWIRQGRIQYKEDKNKKIIGHHCARCGELIAQGEFCVHCRTILKRQKGSLVYDPKQLDEKLRYLNPEDEP